MKLSKDTLKQQAICNQNVLQNDPYVELYRLQSQKYSADIVGRNYNYRSVIFQLKHGSTGLVVVRKTPHSCLNT